MLPPPVLASKILSEMRHVHKHDYKPTNNQQQNAQQLNNNEEVPQARTRLRTNRIRRAHNDQNKQRPQLMRNRRFNLINP